jgi:beta-N-acetylhexosaminidase
MKLFSSLLFLCTFSLYAQEGLHIIQKPILFTQKRVALTLEYMQKHYGITQKDIRIKPQMIVVHATATKTLEDAFNRFNPEMLLSDRKDIASASALNVSAHFLVARDGKVYQLMPENFMARHVIGLNYYAIGIENVGGRYGQEDLTQAQLKANVMLITYLEKKYPMLKYVIGHYEYREYENSPLWLEKDANYRTSKVDPGKIFMRELRERLKN